MSCLCDFHFFIQRWFGGCEFGVCVDPLFLKIEIDEKYCLFDLNPLILCTVQYKSKAPFLAGILMILLLFITIVTTKLALYLARPETGLKDLLKELWNHLWTMIKDKCKNVLIAFVEKYSPIEKILGAVINRLQKLIYNLLKDKNDPISIIMKTILSIQQC